MSDVRVPREKDACTCTILGYGERDPQVDCPIHGLRADVRVPREAIERLKTWVVLPADQYEQATAEIIEAALPFLRAQWEADLLGDDDTLERAGAWLDEFVSGIVDDPDSLDDRNIDDDVRAFLRAALGSCVRSEGEEA